MRAGRWIAPVSLAIVATVLTTPPACLAQGAAAGTTQAATPDDLKFLTDVLVIIQSQYVDETPALDLIYGAIRGMVGALDPQSWFLDPETYREMGVEPGPGYGSIGLELRVAEGRLTVGTAIEGGPAWRAGVQPGDRLVKLDGGETARLSVPDAVRRLRGRLGTQVAITLQREGLDRPLELVLAREVVQSVSVDDQQIEPGLGYIRIRRLEERTARNLEAALARLRAGAGLSGLVLDLRGSPGGILSAAIEVAEQFLPSGALVSYTAGRVRNQNMRFVARPRQPSLAVPLAVLVDAGTSSGAEIVAAAVQDHRRGVIVGEKTAGIGNIQTIIPLPDGSGLRLTTARFFTPRGRSVHGQGIIPDLVVESPKRDPAAGPPRVPATMADRLREDVQLQRAVDAVKVTKLPRP